MDLYNESNLICLIPDADREELLADKIPESLKTAFAYYILVSAKLREQKCFARMLIHPSCAQAVHAKTLRMITTLKSDMTTEIESAKITRRFPETLLAGLKLATYEHWAINPQIIIDVLNELEILVYNTDTDTSGHCLFDKSGLPLLKNQILIGGNKLGRGIRIPVLQVVYYTRVAKKPQFDTMWQHSRVFGYDRKKELVRIFFDQKTHHLFQLMTESSYSLMNFIRDHELAEVSIKCPDTAMPTRKNVIPSNLFYTLTGGQHYFTSNIQDYTQNTEEISRLLADFPDNAYSSIDTEAAVKLLALIGGDTVLDFVRDCILADKATIFVKAIKGKDIKDEYRSALSETEFKLSNSHPKNFTLTFCLLTPSRLRSANSWLVDVRLPDQFIYARTIDQLLGSDPD